MFVHWLGESSRLRSVTLSLLGYALAGIAVGGLTLLLFPSHFIDDPDLRRLNVLLTPLIIGTLMAAYGRFRARRDRTVAGLEKFAYAFAFALAIAIVRYQFAG